MFITRAGIFYLWAVSFSFYKYQGTGNDFVIVDNRLGRFPKNDVEGIARICDRRFGVGADGLILLEDHPELDFTMVYFNADGHPSSMCGNGGRCLVNFARHMGLVRDACSFEAVDGIHRAQIEERQVRLSMNDVHKLSRENAGVFLDTGSPHLVLLVEDTDKVDVLTEGRRLRNELYGEQGSNINFVQPLGENEFRVRTYERGVEDETLSCGTGVTAVALAMDHLGKAAKGSSIKLITPGGELRVDFEEDNGLYSDIWLSGPAQFVFKGDWHG